MRRLMLAFRSEVIAQAIAERLWDKYDLCLCSDGLSALEQFSDFQPQVLVLDLSLPIIDGLTLLKKIPETSFPQIVIGVSAGTSDLVSRLAFELGVTHICMLPLQVDNFCETLSSLELQRLLPERSQLQTNRIVDILTLLGFPNTRVSLPQTVEAIRLFHEDPEQKLDFELYPAVARNCGAADKRSVEYNIRTLIAKAWDRRNPEIWSQLIPEAKACPSTLDFLSWINKIL